MKKIKSITAYGIVDYSIQLQEAFKQGYELDVDSNQNCPTSFGTMFVCNVLKENDEVVEETQVVVEDSKTDVVAKAEETSEVEVKQTKGRKTKQE